MLLLAPDNAIWDCFAYALCYHSLLCSRQMYICECSDRWHVSLRAVHARIYTFQPAWLSLQDDYCLRVEIAGACTRNPDQCFRCVYAAGGLFCCCGSCEQAVWDVLVQAQMPLPVPGTLISILVMCVMLSLGT
jgi:hypothetical protein